MTHTQRTPAACCETRARPHNKSALLPLFSIVTSVPPRTNASVNSHTRPADNTESHSTANSQGILQDNTVHRRSDRCRRRGVDVSDGGKGGGEEGRGGGGRTASAATSTAAPAALCQSPQLPACRAKHLCALICNRDCPRLGLGLGRGHNQRQR